MNWCRKAPTLLIFTQPIPLYQNSHHKKNNARRINSSMQCNSSPFYMHRPKLWKGGRLWLQDNCENHHDITWCQRILVFPPKRVEDTRQGQVVDIMAGHVFVWTRLTKPGETCIYQTRVFFCHNLRTWTGVYIYYFEIEVQSPNPNLSITPGLNGSMRTSAEPQSFLRTFTPDI